MTSQAVQNLYVGFFDTESRNAEVKAFTSQKRLVMSFKLNCGESQIGSKLKYSI